MWDPSVWRCPVLPHSFPVSLPPAEKCPPNPPKIPVGTQPGAGVGAPATPGHAQGPQPRWGEDRG